MNNLIGITGVTGSGKDTVAKALLYLAASKKYSNSLKTFEECSFEEAAFSNLGWEVKRFAGPLKNFVAEVLGVTRRQLEDRKFKESTLGDEWTQYRVLRYEKRDDQEFNLEGYTYSMYKPFTPFIFDTLGEAQKFIRDTSHYCKLELVILTPRSIMELIGTEVGRTIHPNFHVNALFSKYIPIGDNLLEGEVRKVREEDLVYPRWIIPDCRFDNEAKTIKERGGIVIKVNRDIPSINSHASNAGVSDEYVDYELDNNKTIEDLINQVKKLNLI